MRAHGNQGQAPDEETERTEEEGEQRVLHHVLKQTAVQPCVQGFAPHCACTFRACCVWLMNE